MFLKTSLESLVHMLNESYLEIHYHFLCANIMTYFMILLMYVHVFQPSSDISLMFVYRRFTVLRWDCIKIFNLFRSSRSNIFLPNWIPKCSYSVDKLKFCSQKVIHDETSHLNSPLPSFVLLRGSLPNQITKSKTFLPFKDVLSQ